MNWISFPDLSILTRTILHKIVMQSQIRCVALYKIYVSEKLMIAQILPFCHSRNEFSDFATAFMNFSSNSWGCSEILRMRIKVQFFHEYLKNVDDRKTVNLRYCSWKKTCFFHNEHFDKSVLHQIEFCTHTKKEKIWKSQ